MTSGTKIFSEVIGLGYDQTSVSELAYIIKCVELDRYIPAYTLHLHLDITIFWMGVFVGHCPMCTEL